MESLNQDELHIDPKNVEFVKPHFEVILAKQHHSNRLDLIQNAGYT